MKSEASEARKTMAPFRSSTSPSLPTGVSSVQYGRCCATVGILFTNAVRVYPGLILFTLIYLLLFVLFIYLLNEKIQHGPVEDKMAEEGRRA